MKKVSRLYFKNKRLIVESRKTQKGGFFPIAAALAPLAGEVITKIFGRDKKCANTRPGHPLRKVILVSKRHR